MSRPVHSPVRPRPAAPDRHLESPKPPRGPRTSLREAQARPRRLPRPPTRPFAARLQAPTCTPLSPDREGPPKAAHSSVRPPPSGARSTPPDPETAAAALEHALQRRGTALGQHLTRAPAPSPCPQTGTPSRLTGEALSPYRGRSQRPQNDAALPDDPIEKKKALRALVQGEAAEQREAQAKDPDHETLAERIQATDDATDLRAQTTRRTERVSSDRPTPEKVVHLRQYPRRDRLDRERARQEAQAGEGDAPRASKPPRHKPES